MSTAWGSFEASIHRSRHRSRALLDLSGDRMLRPMDELTQKAVEGICQYMEAGDRLVAGIHIAQAKMAEDVARISAGATISEALLEGNSAARSRKMTALLADFEDYRRKVRISIATAAAAEGMSTRQIGSQFGASRQWASRFLIKKRADD